MAAGYGMGPDDGEEYSEDNDEAFISFAETALNSDNPPGERVLALKEAIKVCLEDTMGGDGESSGKKDPADALMLILGGNAPKGSSRKSE